MSAGSPQPLPWAVPATALTLSAGLGLVRWAIGPATDTDFPVGPFLLGVAWLYIETVMAREGSRPAQTGAIHRWHRVVFAAIGLYEAGWHGLALAADLEVLASTWLPLTRRGMLIAAGTMLGIWGNYLPKVLSPWRIEDEPFDWQGVHRIVGWLASSALRLHPRRLRPC